MITESPILALQQQRMLLEIEYNVDKEEHRRQMEAKGLERLAKRGDAWLNVRFGRSYYNSLNQLSIELYRTQDQDVEHNFEFGRPVWILRKQRSATEGKANEGLGKRNEGLGKYLSGVVNYVDGDRMVVVVPDGTDIVTLQTAETLTVQLAFDETTYRLMFEALDRTIRAKGRLGYLRDLFYSSQKAETFSFAPMQFPFLNASQERAVNEVLSRSNS